MKNQALNEYRAELRQMDDPRDDDSNIDFAVSTKLLTVSKAEEETWLAESITEQDSESLMANVRAYLDGRSDQAAFDLAELLADQLSDYMQSTIIADWLSLEPDTAEPEDMVDHYEENKLAA